MTAGTRYQFTRTLPSAADRLAEFERQDRLERRLTWFSLVLAILATLGWLVALV